MNQELSIDFFLEKVNEILSSVLETNALPTVTITTDLVSGIGANSISLSSIEYVEFILMIEKEFGVVYSFEKELNTVRELYDYIISYRNNHHFVENDIFQ